MKKTAIRLLPLVLALLLLFAGCAPKQAAPDTGETCTLVIDCLIPYEAGHQIAKDCSDKGYIVEEVTLPILEGDTVYTVTARICEEEKIPVAFAGSEGSRYITAINSLGEMDCGDTSGWLYLVNGEMAMDSCDNIKVQPGDAIAWRYSLAWGEDF